MGLHAVKATLARRGRAYLLSRPLSEGKGCWRRRADSARILMGRGIRFALGLVSGAGKGDSRVKLRDHMGLYVGTILEGDETLPAAGQRLFTELFVFASGRLTKAEISGYTNSMDIYVTGPVI